VLGLGYVGLPLACAAAGAGRSARNWSSACLVTGGDRRPDPSRVAEQILSDAQVDARMQAMLTR